MISADGQVLTALIGNIPTVAMREELDALLTWNGRDELPYVGYDAFEGRDRRVARSIMDTL